MTNTKRLSNKEMRKADEFIKAIFDGDQDLVGSLLGLKPNSNRKPRRCFKRLT